MRALQHRKTDPQKFVCTRTPGARKHQSCLSTPSITPQDPGARCQLTHVPSPCYFDGYRLFPSRPPPGTAPSSNGTGRSTCVAERAGQQNGPLAGARTLCTPSLALAPSRTARQRCLLHWYQLTRGFNAPKRITTGRGPFGRRPWGPCRRWGRRAR